jgi:hypothetical protein
MAICQNYDELVKRCRSKQRQRYSTEQLECMMLSGVTEEEALKEVNKFLGGGGRKITSSDFKSFIKHRKDMGWVIKEEKGVWKVIDIRP